MRFTIGMVCVLLFISSPAAAQFEGVLTAKLTSAAGEFVQEISVSQNGLRTDLKPTQQMQLAMTIILKPQLSALYMLNNATKKYTEQPLKSAKSKRKSEFPVKLTKLGTEKILGYTCEHFTIEAGRETEQGRAIVQELWTTTEFGDVAKTFEQVQRSFGGTASADMDAVYQEMKAQGVMGFPMKTIQTSRGQIMSLVIIKIEKKKLPASLFEIPADYQKSEAGQAVTPEDLDKLREQLKKSQP
jgi:hypothetical protein